MSRRLIANGDKLRELREEAWLNQRDLAEKAGLAEHTVMRIELGHTPHPTRTTVKKLADVLGVHPSMIARVENNGSGDVRDLRPLS